jgi:hypothetical protein
MTVSTKTPTNRASGSPSGGSGGRPIPAPRVVNNRRIRTGGVLLAVLLLVLGAALSALALLSATRTSAYLAVGSHVDIGTKITAQDLTTVQLSGGQGLSAIPASQVNSVIGQYAGVPLVPGTLLSPGQLTNRPIITNNEVEIGLSFPASRLSSANLAAGDRIVLFPLATGPGTQFNATVVDVGARASDGSVGLHLAVGPDEAAAIVSLSANGGLGMYQQPATGN